MGINFVITVSEIKILSINFLYFCLEKQFNTSYDSQLF
jgi:hypothetical protein